MLNKHSDNETGEQSDTGEEATGRALMVLKSEMGTLSVNVDRVRVQIDALAKRHGIE